SPEPAGLAALTLMHVAYVLGFVLLGVDAGRLVAGGVLFAIAGILLSRPLVSRAPRPSRPALVAYVLALSLMGAFALAASRVAAGFALAFYLGDFFLARHRFAAGGARDRAAGLLLRVLARAGFALVAAGLLR